MNRAAVTFVTFGVLACARQTRQEAAVPAAPTPASPSNIQAVSGEIRAKEGIRYIDVEVGKGPLAQTRQCVYAHYTGFLANGTKFDSSRNPAPDGSPGTPLGFVLGVREVIAGWDIGFDGMKVGGKRRLFVPPSLGYGPRGAGGVIPPNAELMFDVELVGLSEPRPNRTCRAWR
jgi:peptidylprolyl isomerase